jgi:hypothetical protein
MPAFVCSAAALRWVEPDFGVGKDGAQGVATLLPWPARLSAFAPGYRVAARVECCLVVAQTCAFNQHPIDHIRPVQGQGFGLTSQ